MPASPPPSSTLPGPPARAGLVHREFVVLTVLIAVAIGAFFLTRAVANSNREMTLRDAEEWYERGRTAQAKGALDDAITGFRRARARNRQDRRYVLALAQALALRHDDEAARAALMSLRETTPEDPDVNVALARLAAGRGHQSEAERFYRGTLNALWQPSRIDQRRRVRLELARFLLRQGDNDRATAELMAVSSEAAADAPLRVALGELLSQAGDRVHALAEFQQALRLAPADPRALVGAGRTAYELGDYLRARAYLRQAPSSDPVATRTLATVEFVLANDPLAPHVGAAERRRRLGVDLAYAQQRLAACVTTHPASVDTDGALRQALSALDAQARGPRRIEQDTIEAGVDLVERVADHLVVACQPSTPIDEALRVIGRRHRSES